MRSLRGKVGRIMNKVGGQISFLVDAFARTRDSGHGLVAAFARTRDSGPACWLPALWRVRLLNARTREFLKVAAFARTRGFRLAALVPTDCQLLTPAYIPPTAARACS